MRIIKQVKARIGQSRGVSLSGYGLLVGLVAVVALTATTNIGGEVARLFGGVADDLTGSAQALADPSPAASASPDDGAPDLLAGQVSMDTNVVLEDITAQALALFDDADTPLVATLAANGDGSCVTVVQFDAGAVRLSTAAAPCSGSFQIVVEDSEGNATPFTTIAVTVTDPPAQTSCAAYQAYNPLLPSGTYSIDPDGPGGNAPFDVHCDMDNNGGGWIRCASFRHVSSATYGLNYLTTNYTGNTWLNVGNVGNFCHQISFTQIFAEARLTNDTLTFRTAGMAASASLFQNDNGGVRVTGAGSAIATYTRSSHSLNYHVGTDCSLFDNGQTQGHHLCITDGSDYQAVFGDINRSLNEPRGIHMCHTNSNCGLDTANVVLLYVK